MIRKYSPLRRLTFSFCGGPWPLAEDFFDFCAKKKAVHAACAYFRPFWCSVGNSVILKILREKTNFANCQLSRLVFDQSSPVQSISE